MQKFNSVQIVAYKFSKFTWFLFLSLSPIFLSACSTIPASQTPLPVVRFTNTVSSIDLTATVAVAESETPTPYEIPTELLANLEEYSDWLFSINESSQCKLPCWWGFIPESTQWENVLLVFEPFGVLTTDAINAPGYDVHSISSMETKVGELTVTSWVKDNLYSNLFVNLDPSTSSPEELDYISDHYGFAAILQDYGQPTTGLVGLRSSASDPNDPYWEYELWLVYEKFGLLVRYTGPYLLPTTSDERIQVCVDAREMNNIQMILQSTKVGNQLTKITNFASGEPFGIDAQVADSRLIAWEEATQASFMAFYDLAVSGSENLCFSSPVSLWES